MRSFCQDVVALAQGDQTARLEMASGLSQSSALHPLKRVVASQAAASVSQHHRLKDEARDVLSLRIHGEKSDVHLGVGWLGSTRSESPVRLQLFQDFRVRFLESSFQTISQSASGGGRMSSACKDAIALAQGDQAARLEIASLE